MAGERLRLAGQVAVVAGATRGAGRGIARSLGEAGALVYCTGRSAAGHKGMDRPETLEETVALIEKAGGRAVAVRTDHTHEEEVASLAAQVRRDAGRLDVLVNSIWGVDPKGVSSCGHGTARSTRTLLGKNSRYCSRTRSGSQARVQA